MTKLPKYTHAFVDVRGKPRHYFRRAGFKKMPLPGTPWTPEFMAAYEAAMAQQTAPIVTIRARPGSLRALSISYFRSTEHRTLAASTRDDYRTAVERLCQTKDAAGVLIGDKRVSMLKREHIVKMMAARADRPEAANKLRKVLRVLMAHAVDIGMRTDDPTRDVKAIRVKTTGYHSWTEDEIEKFEARHAIGTMARLAFALLLFTGQRRSDVVRMGRQHLRNGTITLRQKKTSTELSIPVHSELAAVLTSSPMSQMTFIVTAFGAPFSNAGFGNKMREWCDEAGLKNCSAHGLRKAAARRLAEAGASASEIASITGHKTLKEVQRYVAAADQKRLALNAMARVKPRTDGG